MTILLKTLLMERHTHSHADFLADYDRHARVTDPRSVGRGPTRTQYYRWLSGKLTALPRGYHCRVLEAMFPGWTAERLFTDDPNTISTAEAEIRLPELLESIAAGRSYLITDQGVPIARLGPAKLTCRDSDDTVWAA